MFQLFFTMFLTSGFALSDAKFSLDAYFSMTDVKIQKNGINPNNQVLELPHSKSQVDIRPEVKWQEARWQTVVRPRLIQANQDTEVNQLSQTTSKTTFDLTDAFIENNWNSSLTTTIGLQVYQWGPAEFLNPSNPFSHFNPQQKNLMYKEKGRGLLRVNYSMTKQDTLVLAVEPVSNNTPEWIADDSFKPKGFLKYERSWPGTFNSIGITIGQGEKEVPFIGEYFSYSISEGTSIYADVKHQKHNMHYEPISNGLDYDMEIRQPYLDRWNTLAVLGVRFERAFDLRFEYIYNGAGYTEEQLENAVASASQYFSENYAQNARRFYRPGLEIMGQSYLYSSFRLMDPPWIKDFSFYLRWLYSMQDESSQVQLEFEKSFLDSFTLYAGQNLSQFQSQTLTNFSEFRLAQSDESFVGLRWSF